MKDAGYEELLESEYIEQDNAAKLSLTGPITNMNKVMILSLLL